MENIHYSCNGIGHPSPHLHAASVTKSNVKQNADALKRGPKMARSSHERKGKNQSADIHTIIEGAYLTYHSLPVNLKQSVHSPSVFH